MLTPTRVPAQRVGPARVTPPPLQQPPGTAASTPANVDTPPPAVVPVVPPPPEPPRVIPIVPPPPTPAGPDQPRETRPLVRQSAPDSTGLVPNRPSVTGAPRPPGVVTRQMSELLEVVQDAEAEINVVVGRSKLIQTRRALTRIAIANPAVADIIFIADQPDPREFNVYGKSFGTTSLTLWDADNRPLTFLVRVTLDTRDVESRLKQTFPGADVHVRQVGMQVILEGQVPDSKTMSDVLQLITMEVRGSGGLGMGGLIGGAGMGGAAGGQNAGMGGGQTGGMGGGMSAGMGGGMSGGMASGGQMMGGAVGGAGGAGMQRGVSIINRVNVPGPRQVLLKVKIAELNRTAIRELGISWLNTRNNAILGSTIGGAATITGQAGPVTQASQFLPGAFTQGAARAPGVIQPIASAFNATGQAVNANAQLFGIFNAGQFSLFLNALRANSLAKILAEPNLMAVDGQPARFLAGGQFPYPVPQSSSIPGGTAVVTVQFANFGAILSFLPHILANDVIRLDVEPVFSQLDFAGGTVINGGRVPAIAERSARTVVELREGQTLAIAGLLQTRTNASTVRVPGLGDLPIVGPWFSSNRIETVETELVVLVTPELVAPMEAKEVPLAPGDRYLEPNDYEFYFLGRIEGRTGHPFRSTIRELDPLDVMKHFRSEEHWVVGPHGHAE